VRNDVGALFEEYISASDPAQGEQALQRLLAACEPIIATAIRAKLGLGGPSSRSARSAAEDEASDLIGDAYVAALCWLRALKDSPPRPAIKEFSSYLQGMLRRIFYDWLRRRHPARHRLKSRLHALAAGDTPVSGFSTWRSASGGLLLGYDEWRGREPRLNAKFRAWLEDPGSLPQRGPVPFSELPLPVLVARVLDRIGSPIDLDQLVNGLSRLVGLVAPRAIPEDAADHALAAGQGERDPAQTAIRHVQADKAAHALAEEVCALPERQAQALLLALPQDELLALVSLATPSRVAALLGCPLSELGRALGEVPVPDLLIARRLGLRRQQVVNLRKCARERLRRRLQASGNSF